MGSASPILAWYYDEPRSIAAKVIVICAKGAHLHALGYEGEVEELEGNPELPVGDDCAWPILLQLFLDVPTRLALGLQRHILISKFVMELATFS